MITHAYFISKTQEIKKVYSYLKNTDVKQYHLKGNQPLILQTNQNVSDILYIYIYFLLTIGQYNL